MDDPTWAPSSRAPSPRIWCPRRRVNSNPLINDYTSYPTINALAIGLASGISQGHHVRLRVHTAYDFDSLTWSKHVECGDAYLMRWLGGQLRLLRSRYDNIVANAQWNEELANRMNDGPVLEWVAQHDQAIMKGTSEILAVAAVVTSILSADPALLGLVPEALALEAATVDVVSIATDDEPCKFERGAVAVVLSLLGGRNRVSGRKGWALTGAAGRLRSRN